MSTTLQTQKQQTHQRCKCYQKISTKRSLNIQKSKKKLVNSYPLTHIIYSSFFKNQTQNQNSPISFSALSGFSIYFNTKFQQCVDDSKSAAELLCVWQFLGPSSRPVTWAGPGDSHYHPPPQSQVGGGWQLIKIENKYLCLFPKMSNMIISCLLLIILNLWART